MSAPFFANSAFVRAPERLVMRGGRWRMLDIKVRYGFWRHPRHGVVLIDTGYGPRVIRGAGRGLALRLYAAVLGPRLVEPDSLSTQLARLGLAKTDVGTVIVTHFHGDHLAALRDFPAARFLASGAAFDSLCGMSQAGRLHNGVFMELLPDDFANRLVRIEDQPLIDLPIGLGAGHDLFGDGTLAAVPLPGHALGHFGLLWPQTAPPLLYAVDTQWLWQAIVEDRMPGWPARLVFSDMVAARRSSARVRAFARGGGEVILCHDPGTTRHDV